MDSQDEAHPSQSWFDNQIDSWADFGWDVSGIEDYLRDNSDLASEALLHVEYLVNLSTEMKSRLDFSWIEKNSSYEELFDNWLLELNNPMNGKIVKQEYELWATDNRPWELVYQQVKNEWNAVRKGEEIDLILARCDSLDPTSYPQISILLPMFKSPEMAFRLDKEISRIEQNEARQKRTIFNAIESLKEQGYDADYILDMPMVQALEQITQKQKQHTEHESIRLLIIDQLSSFDDKIAQDYENQRLQILSNGNEIDLMRLKSKIMAISDDLYKRLSSVNDIIFSWREKGIIFPHDDAIRPEELMQWETNIPEIENSVNQHLEWLKRYQKFTNLWPEVIPQGESYVGYLEHTENLIDIVEDLQQEWRRIELECHSLLEKYQNQGLLLDTHESMIEEDPKSAFAVISNLEPLWQHRVDCIAELLDIDVSFEGADSVNKRILLLKEIEAGNDIIEDTKIMIGNYVKRRTRHRRMLESELLDLIKQGKASDETASSRLNLHEFEEFVANSRKYGMSKNITITGNSVVTSAINERLERKLVDELAQYNAAGWYTGHLSSQLDSSPIELAKILTMVRGLIKNHESLRRRLSALPWNRDVNLAIQVQEQLQDPLKLAELSDNIPSFMKHLSVREVEDEQFEFKSWKPEPIRKTLLPIPEQVQTPSSTLEEAHEAILESMEREEEIREDEKIREDGLTDHEFWDDEKWSAERWRWWREREALTLAKQEEKEETSQSTEIHEESTKPLTISKQPSSQENRKEKAHEGLFEQTSLKTYQSLLQTLGLKKSAKLLQNIDSDSVKMIRKSLATHVGVEPRDVRVDRMLRVLLRLLPNGDEKDLVRSDLVTRIDTSLPKYNKWMKSRLEARHSGSKGNFLMDSKNLGNALNRIPGPGFAIPLNKDDKVLPNSQDLNGLSKEVEILLRSMNLPSASGIVVEAA